VIPWTSTGEHNFGIRITFEESFENARIHLGLELVEINRDRIVPVENDDVIIVPILQPDREKWDTV
jgi:hypothetical protein